MRTLPSPNSRVQQCRTPSTNCTESNLVELHRRPSRRHIVAEFQSSTMSNSIDQLYEVQPSQTSSTTASPTMTVNNVELHRQSYCMPSPAMSNSIDASQQCRTPSTSHSVTMVPPVNNVELHRQPSAVELRHGELSSCAIHILNTCNLLSTRPRAVSDSKEK